MNEYIFNSDTYYQLATVCILLTLKPHGLLSSLIYEAMMLFIPKFQLYSKQHPNKDLYIYHQLKCLHAHSQKNLQMFTI